MGWKDAPEVGGSPAWASAPEVKEDPYAFQKEGGRQVLNLLAGGARGAGSFGATLLAPRDALEGFIARKMGAPELQPADRRKAMTDALGNMGADTDSLAFGVGKIGAEMAGTAGIGGLFARGAQAAGAAPTVVNALRTGGMTTGAKPLTFGAKAADLALRTGAGAAVGGASAAAVNPDDAEMGAAIGAALPGAIKLIGAVGNGVAWAWNAMMKRGDRAGADALVKALEAGTPAQKKAIVDALKNSAAILPGSDLTVSQALQKGGVRNPGAQMLERIVSQGPGGDALLNRYAEQGAARTGALAAQGAETYQGAASDLAERTGSKIGATLRTQAADDAAAARAAWEQTYATGARNKVAMQLPLDEMGAAMSPLGRGTVGAGNDARALFGEAQNIGTMELPAIKALPKSAGSPQTLEQAVRSMGGIKEDLLKGEWKDLGPKASGTTGLMNNKSGKSADMVAQIMHERGFIPDSDPATLFAALRNGGGRKVFANDAPESAFARMRESAMGDAPAAERVPVAVPFDEFQRLRRSAGALGAKVGERAGGETEAGVLNKLQELLTKRADDAVAGLKTGDNMTPEFLSQYNTARGMTRQNAELYKGGNNISQILRKPVGQDYTLGGDEITNKLWHGGAGLVDDIARLKGVLSDSNRAPAMEALQKFILTDAASKVTASGNLASAFPKYVESRFPGLAEALTPEQMKVLSNVAADIRNAEAASAVPGMRGSDTYAKASRALDAGLLDSQGAKAIAKALAIKGVGLEWLRAKMAENTVKSKGSVLAELLANPSKAAAALSPQQAAAAQPNEILRLLMQGGYRSAPVIGSQ